MSVYHLACIDLTTGEDRTEAIVADDEKEAMSIASDRGLIATGVLKVEQPPTKAESETVESKPPAARTRGDRLPALVGYLMSSVGMGLLVWAMFIFDTTVDDPRFSFARMPDPALMNQRLCYVVIGVGLLIAGVVQSSMQRLARRRASNH